LFIKIFFPPDHRALLPISIAKRIPPLIVVNVVLFLFFHLAGVSRFAAHPDQYRLFYSAVAITSIAHPLSLILVRLRRYAAASLLGSFAMLLNVLWLVFFVPSSSPNDLYRFSTYIIAAIIANSLVSFSRRQIILFAATSIVAYALYVALVLVPLLGSRDPELRSIGLTVTLLLVAANAIVFAISALSRDLLELAELQATAMPVVVYDRFKAMIL